MISHTPSKMRSRMAKNISYFVIALITLSVKVAANNITTDQHSLLILKDHITSDPTNSLATNWSSDTNVCHWVGVTCSRGRVTALNLSSFGLQGTVPSEVGYLFSLQVLDLSLNKLSGTIPPALFNCKGLQYLDLSFNRFSGFVTNGVGNLTRLKELNLHSNYFQGMTQYNISLYIVRNSLHIGNFKSFTFLFRSISRNYTNCYRKLD